MHITGDFQSVTGLKTGNQVKYSGVTVGRVSSMEVTAKGVTLTMDIDKDTEIPIDSEFAWPMMVFWAIEIHSKFTTGTIPSLLKDG